MRTHSVSPDDDGAPRHLGESVPDPGASPMVADTMGTPRGWVVLIVAITVAAITVGILGASGLLGPRDDSPVPSPQAPVILPMH